MSPRGTSFLGVEGSRRGGSPFVFGGGGEADERPRFLGRVSEPRGCPVCISKETPALLH